MSLSHLLQIQALREALERAARASLVADERSLLALRDLHIEKARSRGLEDELRVAHARYEDLFAENRRLRNLMGEVAQDKDAANSELRTLLQEVRDLTPAPKAPGASRRDAA